MLSGKIPIIPLETGSTKQFREYNIPQILLYRVWNWIIITNRVWIYKSITEFKSYGKTNDSLATIGDIMMKPVHDVIHPQMYHLKNKATSKAEYTNTQQDLPD